MLTEKIRPKKKKKTKSETDKRRSKIKFTKLKTIFQK